MDDIAAAANVSKRTPYARYGSKTGLLVAVMRHEIDDRLKPIAATMRTGYLRERLLRTAQKMLDLRSSPRPSGLKSSPIGFAVRMSTTSTSRPCLVSIREAG
ncbi:helix-turn-helix domain-containing protein [Sphingobium sp.]|uniref:TetR/AcrR family transcriptional regulator n=1 Tax=Sphingobium sp. TaxID=1912891 RepID=UPI00257D48FA|nr:helix-turn-helix domain-containing protein [Sphingobium sp.]